MTHRAKLWSAPLTGDGLTRYLFVCACGEMRQAGTDNLISSRKQTVHSFNISKETAMNAIIAADLSQLVLFLRCRQLDWMNGDGCVYLLADAPNKHNRRRVYIRWSSRVEESTLMRLK